MKDVHKEVKSKSMHHLHSGEAKHRKKGGPVESGNDKEYGGGWDMPEPDVEDAYAGGKSNVKKEADGDERKKGGKVHKKSGGAAKKEVGKVEGEHKKHRLDRPGRKRGGGVGADVTPLSSANKTDDRRGPSASDDRRGITGEA